jgi:hypothetical protein
MSAYAGGRHAEVSENPALAEDFPYWEYIAVVDHRTGGDHLANLEGGVGGTAFYPAETSFEEARGDRPYNCRCSMRWVPAYEAERLGLTKLAGREVGEIALAAPADEAKKRADALGNAE